MARVKNYSDPSDVIHRWANQNLGDIRGSYKKVSYGGYDKVQHIVVSDDCNTLYSYGFHWALGVHTKDNHNIPCVLLTTRDWVGSTRSGSDRVLPTTRKHKDLTHMATKHLNRFFVPRANFNFQDNMNLFIDDYNELIDQLSRFRAKWKIKNAENSLYHIFVNMRRYYWMFKPGTCESSERWLPVDQIPWNRDENPSKEKVFEILNIEEIVAFSKEEIKKQKAKDKADSITRFENWKKGYIGHISIDDVKRATGIYTDWVKVIDEDTVVTSQGVEMSVVRDKAIWMLQKKITEGHFLTFEERSVDPWHIDSYDADGTLNIGCHTISIEVGNMIAEELGWTNK